MPRPTVPPPALDLDLGLPAPPPETRARVPRRLRGADPALKALGQYDTPLWAIEELVATFFPDLGAHDVVLEPSCGRRGGFLHAIPPHVTAYGVELDPVRAELARQATGRPILTGDIRTVPLDPAPTAVIGNPPFSMAVVDAILNRAHAVLPEGGRVGLLLPTSAFQTARRVADYATRWSLQQVMIPRTLYANIQTALCFACFGKERRRTLIGFALYRTAAALQGFRPDVRDLLEDGDGGPLGVGSAGGSVWRRALEQVLQELGGEADIQAIYRAIEGRRPTHNPHWREQVRKLLPRHFTRLGKGRYALPEAMTA